MSSPNALSIYREQNAIRAVFKWAFPASSFSIMSEGTTDHLDVAVFTETPTRAGCAPAWLCVYILATELQEQLSPSTAKLIWAHRWMADNPRDLWRVTTTSTSTKQATLSKMERASGRTKLA